jgi:hypothetical protein
MFNPFTPTIGQYGCYEANPHLLGTLLQDWMKPSMLNPNHATTRDDSRKYHSINPNMVELIIPFIPYDPNNWFSPNLNFYERGEWYGFKRLIEPINDLRSKSYIVEHPPSNFFRSFPFEKDELTARTLANECADHFCEWNELYINRVREISGTPWSEMQAANRPDILITFNTSVYPLIKDYVWRVTFSQGRNDVRATIDHRNEYLHTFLMGRESNKQVDHIDGNTLDNRLCNLRQATPEENRINRGCSFDPVTTIPGIVDNGTHWLVDRILNRERVRMSFPYNNLTKQEALQDARMFLMNERQRRGLTPIPRPLQQHFNVKDDPIFVPEFPHPPYAGSCSCYTPHDANLK